MGGGRYWGEFIKGARSYFREESERKNVSRKNLLSDRFELSTFCV